MTLLYLVRHGETDWNLARRIQGSTDIPLNETGRAQAARTGDLLAKRHWDLLASSPLSRAYETAQIVGSRIGIDDIEILDDIVERHYGEAEGLTDREISAQFPDQMVPSRESHDAVALRVVPALLGLAGRHHGRNVVVVTHGGVIRTVLNTVAPASHRHRGVPIVNGSIHSFRVTPDGMELVAFDDPIDG